MAFGTKVCLYSDGKMQMQEQNPVRGYYSSVDQDLIFGLVQILKLILCDRYLAGREKDS